MGKEESPSFRYRKLLIPQVNMILWWTKALLWKGDKYYLVTKAVEKVLWYRAIGGFQRLEIREKMDLKQIGRRNGKIGGIRAESYHDLLQIKNDVTPWVWSQRLSRCLLPMGRRLTSLRVYKRTFVMKTAHSSTPSR